MIELLLSILVIFILFCITIKRAINEKDWNHYKVIHYISQSCICIFPIYILVMRLIND